KADELKTDISCLKRAMVGGEYLPPALRKSLGERGIRVMQSYATADLGLLAYESTLADGSVTEGMILDEDLLLEIVRPGTGDPVGTGEVGEVVITSFNPDYPLIRFGTGDLSAMLAGASPCGRTNVRIKGWMGRADQTTKVRGMFVTPKQVGEIVRRHPEIVKARLVIAGATGNDSMTLRCELKDKDAWLEPALIASIRDVTKLRGDIEFLPAGSLPNDGKVIDDTRKYD
ncbi:MAG: phenylacetate--CoA ligase family protein, partial [Pseudomonadota bacterium]